MPRKEKHLYEVRVSFAASKVMKVKAVDRREAIEKASRRAESQGLEVTILSLPYLPHDEV